MSDWRCVIAFSEPPARFRFQRSASKKTWFRVIEGRQWAKELARQLSERDIHGVIKKIDPPKLHGGRSPALDKLNRRHKNRQKAVDAELERQEELRLAREAQARADLIAAAFSAPQHKASTNLPEPITPVSPKRMARSLEEEREMKYGKQARE